MASVNKVILIGHLGADPETRYMPSGDAVVNMRMATSEQWKDKDSGEKREATEWHSLVAFRRLAEICSEYCSKGAMIYVEGRLKTRKWQDKDGNDRYTTEIRGDRMQMLGSRGGGGGGGMADFDAPPDNAPPKGKPAGSGGGGGFGDMDDDIPF